jgi:hypothetical protein
VFFRQKPDIVFVKFRARQLQRENTVKAAMTPSISTGRLKNFSILVPFCVLDYYL